MDDSKSRMWIELSSGKEEDWRTCLKICRRAFQEDPLYKYTHPDPGLRAQFIEKYFDYLYHVVFKNGRGMLVVIKTEESSGGEKVIGGIAVTVDWDEEAGKDVSSWRSVDEEGWKKHEKRDDWEVEHIYLKLLETAKVLGTTLLPGVFQIVDDGYRGQGIGTRFVMKGVQMLDDEFVRQKRLAGEVDPKPPISYCICDHQRSRMFTKNCGFLEVAQLRTNIPLGVNDELTYTWVYVFPPKDPTWVDIVRRAFHYPSNL